MKVVIVKKAGGSNKPSDHCPWLIDGQTSEKK